MKLSANQLQYRVGTVKMFLTQKFTGLDPGDVRDIMRQAAAEYLPSEGQQADETPKDMNDLILTAMRDGLKNNDAQMVRAALNWQAEQDGKEYLKKLEVEIIPYTIADTSLVKIVLDADETIIAQVEAALEKRRQLALPATASSGLPSGS